MTRPATPSPVERGACSAQGRVDLHVHTTASDGQYSPAQVVQKALDIGLGAISITDHDTTAGVAEALEAAQGTALQVIPGVEISTDLRGSEGYFVSYADGGLSRKLARLRAARLGRARRIISKLSQMGLPLAWEQVRHLATGESVGRPHIAQALLQNGYVSSIDDAFRRYIGRHAPAYVDRFKLSPAEAVQTLLAAEGLPVLAHPRYATHLVPGLVRVGLVGLEAYYTGYTADVTGKLLGLAARHGLLATGGSDFHGERVQSGHDLGKVPVPGTVVQGLCAYRDRRRLRRCEST